MILSETKEEESYKETFVKIIQEVFKDESKNFY